MASIPPTGWADVATKHDLRELEDRLNLRMHALEERLESKMEVLEARMEALEHRVLGELSDRLRVQMQVMVASFAGFATVVIAAVRL